MATLSNEAWRETFINGVFFLFEVCWWNFVWSRIPTFENRIDTYSWLKTRYFQTEYFRVRYWNGKEVRYTLSFSIFVELWFQCIIGVIEFIGGFPKYKFDRIFSKVFIVLVSIFRRKLLDDLKFGFKHLNS